jgi:hypothetical protein
MVVLGGDNISHCEKKCRHERVSGFGHRDIAVLTSSTNSLVYCLWGWMKSEVNKRTVDTPDELLARILDAAGSIKKREDQLR